MTWHNTRWVQHNVTRVQHDTTHVQHNTTLGNMSARQHEYKKTEHEYNAVLISFWFVYIMAAKSEHGILKLKLYWCPKT